MRENEHEYNPSAISELRDSQKDLCCGLCEGISICRIREKDSTIQSTEPSMYSNI